MKTAKTEKLAAPKHNKVKAKQAPLPATTLPQWGFLTARKDPSGYADDEDKFVTLEMFIEVGDANRRIRALAKVDYAGQEELWEGETRPNGELTLSCVEVESSGVIFEVIRLPLRAVGYVGPVDKRPEEKDELEGYNPWKQTHESEDEEQVLSD